LSKTSIWRAWTCSTAAGYTSHNAIALPGSRRLALQGDAKTVFRIAMLGLPFCQCGWIAQLRNAGSQFVFAQAKTIGIGSLGQQNLVDQVRQYRLATLFRVHFFTQFDPGSRIALEFGFIFAQQDPLTLYFGSQRLIRLGGSCGRRLNLSRLAFQSDLAAENRQGGAETAGSCGAGLQPASRIRVIINKIHRKTLRIARFDIIANIIPASLLLETKQKL
jgi:hypothetical protein